jgi:integral membrane sensor domain MASE1
MDFAVVIILVAAFLGALVGVALALTSVLCGRFVFTKSKRNVARWALAASMAMVAFCAFRVLTHMPYEEEGGTYYISPSGELRLDLVGSASAAIVTLALTWRVALGVRR